MLCDECRCHYSKNLSTVWHNMPRIPFLQVCFGRSLPMDGSAVNRLLFPYKELEALNTLGSVFGPLLNCKNLEERMKVPKALVKDVRSLIMRCSEGELCATWWCPSDTARGCAVLVVLAVLAILGQCLWYWSVILPVPLLLSVIANRLLNLKFLLRIGLRDQACVTTSHERLTSAYRYDNRVLNGRQGILVYQYGIRARRVITP